MAAFYKDFEPEDLPVPGKQVMQLIQYTLREDAAMDMLSRLISVNPSLTAQLLRLVNSAFFGLRHRIHTIPEAVAVLGLNSLKNLVLCFAVKEALSKKVIPGFDIDGFWEDSIRRGVAARLLGNFVDGPVEEAFTAGVLQDIGLLVLFSMEPEKADRWPLLRSHLPAERYKMEEELFHSTHDNVGALLAHQWNLPKDYSVAMSHHHRSFYKRELKDSVSLKKQDILAGIMHLSDLCNAFYTCHDKSGALADLKKKAKLFFAVTDDQVESLLSKVPERVMETSYVLNLSVGNQPGFDEIMEQAGRRLVEDNISYQELTWRLQRSLKERDEYAAGLKREMDTAREIQKSLQPGAKAFREISAFNIPASYLSGDFYDYFKKEDGRIYFCLGDVSGKGTGAALLMSKAISVFRCLCRVIDDIGAVVEIMNKDLCETAIRGMFVTFVGGWFDPLSKEIMILNVGHPPPFLVDDKGIVSVEAADPPLGVLPGIIHPARHFSLKNRRLYLYTDGFTESRLKKSAPDTQDRQLGVKGFLRWLVQSGKMSLDEQAAFIKEQCKKELAPQSDDLTLMILSGE